MLRLLNAKLLVSTILTFILITGCSFFQEEEVYSLAKCGRAASILQDFPFKEAIDFKANSVLKNVKGSAREAMMIGEKLREETEPQGTSTPPVYTLRIAQKWRDSSYCSKIEKEFSEHIQERVNSYTKESISNNNSESSCERFSEQYEFTYRYRATKKFKFELIAAMQSRIGNNLTLLKPFQREFAEAEVKNTNFGDIASEIYSQCKLGGSLASAIQAAPAFKNVQSSVSKSIGDLIGVHKGDSDCGELKEFYCSSTLLNAALRNAYNKSLKCDRSPTFSDYCLLKANDFVAREIFEIEIPILNSAKKKIEEYIQNPRKFNVNFDGNIYLIVRECQVGAQKRDLQGDLFKDYSQNVCLPQAVKEFVSPQVGILKKINKRISEFNVY